MRRNLLLASMLVATALAAGPAASAVPVAGTDKTYTTDAQFDQGTLVDVNHDSPNNNQLQLSKRTAFFPFVNIAASARGTAIRINVNTGAVTGEYRTAPAGMQTNPSRTTVDKFGNVWVANRNESAGGLGSVARIGLVTEGTRANADGTANPAGQYLKGPFAYNTCVDRDGDGLLKTSTTLGNILPWTNAGAADSGGGVSTADDECIINYTRVTGTNTRTVAVDANNDVWVGGLGDLDHEKLSGSTGAPVPGTQFNLGCGGYGGLIDRVGTLWSARGGAGLLRFVPNPSPPPAGGGACLGNGRGNYGLGMDPNTGNIWHSSLGGDNRLYELDPAGNVVNSYAQPFGAQGVVVDKNSHVWMAEIFGSRVWHLAPNPLVPGTHYPVGIVSGFGGVTGVAVDANGKIWGAEINANRASRIDPNPAAQVADANGNKVGAIDLSVSLGAGAGPYNYSDMTGAVLGEITAPVGTWTVVQDGGNAGTPWGKVTWNTEPQGAVPPGTSITFQARAADTEAGLPSQPWVAVSNGTLFGLTGRFIEVRGSLTASPSGASPVLSDVRIETANRPPSCSALAVNQGLLWPPNHTMVQVTVSGATDPDPGDTVTVVVSGVTQDEPVNGLGDGDTSPDAALTAPPSNNVSVRAERSGTGNGRVYRLNVTATDSQGATCTGMVTVGVPRDQGRNGGPVDSAPPSYNSLLP